MDDSEMHQVTDSPQIAELFRHDCIYQSCPPRWTAFRSHEDEDADREARMAAVPIVHRHSFEDKKWETLDFTVNDTHMRKLLSKAFEGYQGLDMKLELWKFTQPYRALVHRWNLLNDLHAELMGDASAEVEEKQAAQTLMDFLSPIMAPSIGAVAQTRETGMVLFDDVWTIFPPSELIFTHVSGIPAIYRVLKYKLKETMSGTFWRITVENVDWDGSKCGYSEKNIKIWRFTGLRNVDSLAAYPLSFHHDLDTLKHKMMERGRKFERLRGYHLQHYKGKAQSLTGDYSERPVEGRVIIDAFAYYTSLSIVKPALRSLSEDVPAMTDRDFRRENSRASYRSESRSREGSIERVRTRSPSPWSFLDAPVGGPGVGDIHGRNEDLTPLTDDQLLMVNPYLLGFELQTKFWAAFNIDDLQDVEWNYEAFEHLVLPEDDKQLAWDFVQSKASSAGEFDDYIKDKGRGLVFLMFGPPGVGKTFTAEAVAERANVPLYSMSASMLGSEPSVIGENLDKALTLCKLWNAMLLLDEADVFMSARTSYNIKGNELVSVFLTQIEYYPGILFLTTNRASDIDFAFQSRIDLFLPYQDLDMGARRRIWDNFITRAGREHFLPPSGDMNEHLDRLSRLALNGREIKNLVKTSQLLMWKNGGNGALDRLYLLAEKRVRALQLLAERGNE